MTVGQRIKAVRNQKKMTQRQLADLCGMADSAIRKYESGTINPKYETLKRIAGALDISVDFFTGRAPFNDLNLLSKYKSIIVYSLVKQGFGEKMSGLPIGSINDYDYWKCISDHIIYIGKNENSSIDIQYKNTSASETVKYTSYVVKLDFGSCIEELAKDDQEVIAYRILKDLCNLNKDGREIALERIWELTKIPEYKKEPDDNENK